MTAVTAASVQVRDGIRQPLLPQWERGQQVMKKTVVATAVDVRSCGSDSDNGGSREKKAANDRSVMAVFRVYMIAVTSVNMGNFGSTVQKLVSIGHYHLIGCFQTSFVSTQGTSH